MANSIKEPQKETGNKTKKKQRRINTLKELLGTYPDLVEELLDAAEQPISQPGKHGIQSRLTKGYQGTDKRHPDHDIKQPIKGSRGQKITALGGAYNHLSSWPRIYVEHHPARLQQFGILRSLYRGRFEVHEDIFCIVSGLLNYRASGSSGLAQRNGIQKIGLMSQKQPDYVNFTLRLYTSHHRRFRVRTPGQETHAALRPIPEPRRPFCMAR